MSDSVLLNAADSFALLNSTGHVWLNAPDVTGVHLEGHISKQLLDVSRRKRIQKIRKYRMVSRVSFLSWYETVSRLQRTVPVRFESKLVTESDYKMSGRILDIYKMRVTDGKWDAYERYLKEKIRKSQINEIKKMFEEYKEEFDENE